MADKKQLKNKQTLPKTVTELRGVLETKEKDLLEARRGHVAGELTNPRVLGSLRKDIARIHTAITNISREEK